MSGRPRTTSFAEGNKQPLNPPLGGMKISSKCKSQLRRYLSFSSVLSSLLEITCVVNMAATTMSFKNQLKVDAKPS